MGAVAEYVDVRVLDGEYSSQKILVIHGCPEIPRDNYAADAGDVEEFRAGDYHELKLVPASRWDGDEIVPLVGKQPAARYLSTRVLAVADRRSDG